MTSQIIITDGIINEEVFNNEKTRLLWVLKESNDTESTEGWDMTKFLRDRRVEEEGLFHYAKWRSTFGLVCKISYGILDKQLTYQDINNFNDEQLTKVLDRIAYINIKKIPGGNAINYDDFNEYMSNPTHLKEVRKQIDMIKPDIVICGNTFHYLFPGMIGFDYNNDWTYGENKITYVNGWHPNARIDHKSYFNDIRNHLHLINRNSK